MQMVINKQKLVALLVFCTGQVFAQTAVPVAITSSAINVSFMPHRVSGTAPLAVFFDATGTTSPAVTSRPFHELEYRFNFGDSGAGTWSNGTGSNTSKNSAIGGPLAAHVYETAGSYSACLIAFDGTNTSPEQCVTITVTAADTTYSGTNTVCISNSTSFTGCPSGATEVSSSSDWDAIIVSHRGNNKRLLFERGGTWQASTAPTFGFDGWTIGAYGSGAKPICEVVTSGQRCLNPGTTSETHSDAKVIDLDFYGGATEGSTTQAISIAGTFNNLLLLRLDVSNFNSSFTAPSGNAPAVHNGIFWVEPTIRVNGIADGGGNGIVFKATRVAILGGDIDNEGNSEHVVRSNFWQRLVISHNTLTTPGTDKSTLSLRGTPWFAGDAPIPPQSYSELGVISDNKISGGTGVTLVAEISPKNTGPTTDARCRDSIFERNWFPSNAAAATVFYLTLSCDNGTARDNLVNLSDATGTPRAFQIKSDDHVSAGPTNNRIYNNSVYSSAAQTTAIGVRISDSGVQNSIVINNLVYLPSVGTPTVVSNLGTGSTISNNSADATTNPSFAVTPPVTPANWQATGASVVDQGIAVPVWSDFFEAARTGTYDLGAVNP